MLILLAFALGVFDISESTTVEFLTYPSCRLNTNWCFVFFLLEYDAGLPPNYDNVYISNRICSPYKKTRSLNNKVEMPSDGLPLSFTHHELVLGFRHNCTETGKIHDFVAYEKNVPISVKKFNFSVHPDFTGQGMHYEDDKERAWERTDSHIDFDAEFYARSGQKYLSSVGMFVKLAKLFSCCCGKKKEAPTPQLTALKLKKQSVKPVKPSNANVSYTGQSTESIGCWLHGSDRAGSPQEVTPLAVVAIEDAELAVEATQRD
ncbi:unnamed protein product [Caenorhabditis angaria]|uniref:Uncharacterized protein n=1 Tax=Caenorhabditis angaria TaxID=860376 RepID=A0A9P1J5M7_9PELO|nr:unnamed protein product [Caenorhabditis angaria]